MDKTYLYKNKKEKIDNSIGLKYYRYVNYFMIILIIIIVIAEFKIGNILLLLGLIVFNQIYFILQNIYMDKYKFKIKIKKNIISIESRYARYLDQFFFEPYMMNKNINEIEYFTIKNKKLIITFKKMSIIGNEFGLLKNTEVIRTLTNNELNEIKSYLILKKVKFNN